MNFLRQQSARLKGAGVGGAGGGWGLSKDGKDDGGGNDTMTEEQAQLEDAMKSIEEAHGATTTNNKQTNGEGAGEAKGEGDDTAGDDDKDGKSGKEIAMEWFQTIGSNSLRDLSNSLRDVGLSDGDASGDSDKQAEADPSDGEEPGGVAKAAAGYFASVSSYFSNGRSSASKTTTSDDSSSAIPRFSLSGSSSVISLTSHDSQGDPEVLHIQNGIKLAKANLKELKDTNRQMTKKHRGDLSSWQQRKASKGREIWMKRQYASNFGLNMYKEILMDCSEACDDHDVSSKTLNAEASLLRAQHNEKMTEQLMAMVHTHQQELIDHFYTDLLPQMKKDREQARPDGERQVKEATKAKEELEELYEKVVELQTTIIEKYRQHLPKEEKTIEECDEFAEEDDDDCKNETVGDEEQEVEANDDEEDGDDDELVERGGKKKNNANLSNIPASSNDDADIKKDSVENGPEDVDEEKEEKAVDEPPHEAADLNLAETHKAEQVHDVTAAEATTVDSGNDKNTAQAAESIDDGKSAPSDVDNSPNKTNDVENDGEEKKPGQESKPAVSPAARARAGRPGGASSTLTRPTTASTASSRTNLARRPLPSAAGGAGAGRATAVGATAVASRSRPVASSVSSRPAPSRPVNGSSTSKSSGLTAEQRAKIRSELRTGGKN